MANKKTFEMSYYNTYYYANVINNVVCNSFDYLSKIDEFYHIGLSIPTKFSKNSNLHGFIRFIIDEIFDETFQQECKDIDKKGLMDEPTKIKPFWFNHALRDNGIEHMSFQEWLEGGPYDYGVHDDKPYSYFYEFLEDPYHDLLQKLAVEVFYILFMNREFLLAFNKLISAYISELLVDENPYLAGKLKRDGVLYRSDIPTWVKDSVFFRDRGHCVFCNTNLTNLITRLTVKNFDHMVPLNLGGANDVSNIQLTCETCNLSKSGTISETSKLYELWYKE